jgi:hypothetical protein
MEIASAAAARAAAASSLRIKVAIRLKDRVGTGEALSNVLVMVVIPRASSGCKSKLS